MLEDYMDLLTVDDVCEILRMSRNTLYALLNQKQIKGFQQGRIWKIPKQAVVEFITKRSGLV